MHAKTTDSLAPPPLHLTLLLLTLVLCRFLYTQWAANHNFLHSFTLTAEPIYADAIRDWLSGVDPYHTVHRALPFVYPPLFLYVGGFVAQIIPAQIGWWLYALVHVASIFALPIVLARYYFRQPWLTSSFALLVFFAEPRFTAILALTNGNIASLMYLLVLLAGVPGLQKNRWHLFYAAVFIGALIKLPLLLLLLFPLLTGTRQWRNSILCVAAVLAVYLAQRAARPDLYAAYRWSIEQQLTALHHYGYGILGIASGLAYKLYGQVGIIPPVLSAVFTLMVVAALFLLRTHIAETSANRLWISLILLSTILADPRVLEYDADIALMAAYVIFVIVLQTRRLVALLILLFIPSLIVPHFIRAQSLVGCYETALLLLAFTGGFASLWLKPAPLRVREPQPA